MTTPATGGTFTVLLQHSSVACSAFFAACGALALLLILMLAVHLKAKLLFFLAT